MQTLWTRAVTAWMTANQLSEYSAFRPALGSAVLLQLMPQLKAVCQKRNNLILGFHHRSSKVCLSSRRKSQAPFSSDRPGLKHTFQDAAPVVLHRPWRHSTSAPWGFPRRWPTQPCARSSSTWGLERKCLQKKTPACGRCAFATSVGALIAHCQAAGSGKFVRRVQEEGFKASQFRYNWKPSAWPPGADGPPRGRGAFHPLEPPVQFWVDPVRP